MKKTLKGWAGKNPTTSDLNLNALIAVNNAQITRSIETIEALPAGSLITGYSSGTLTAPQAIEYIVDNNPSLIECSDGILLV